MIYELRIYRLVANAQDRFLKYVEISRAIRGDNYGKLEGFWYSMSGPLGTLIGLWSFSDLAERTRLRSLLARNEAFQNDYLPLVVPLLLTQENRIMTAIVPFEPPGEVGHYYELRCHRLRVGGAREWVERAGVVRQVVSQYVHAVGLWQTEIGRLHEIVEIWAYRNLGERAQACAKLAADPSWQKFLLTTAPVTMDSDVTLLGPAAFSAMR